MAAAAAHDLIDLEPAQKAGQATALDVKLCNGSCRGCGGCPALLMQTDCSL